MILSPEAYVHTVNTVWREGRSATFFVTQDAAADAFTWVLRGSLGIPLQAN